MKKPCDGCGGAFEDHELVQLTGKSLCGACKEERVRDMQSGVAPGGGISPGEADAIRSRIKKLNLLSFALALPGMALQFGSAAMMGPAETREEAVEMAGTLLLLRLVGAVLFIAGLIVYARMRGRNGLYGLFGLLSCLGLLVLYFLPKRCHHCKASVSYRANECRACGAPA